MTNVSCSYQHRVGLVISLLGFQMSDLNIELKVMRVNENFFVNSDPTVN